MVNCIRDSSPPKLQNSTALSLHMNQFAENDRFAQHIGLELLEASPGHAKAKLLITKEHLNGLHTVHGGAIFTLADFAFAMAANAREGMAMAINVNISYIKAAREGVLIAEAEENSLNRKLANYTVRVTNEGDELIAIFQGMVYRKTGMS